MAGSVLDWDLAFWLLLQKIATNTDEIDAKAEPNEAPRMTGNLDLGFPWCVAVAACFAASNFKRASSKGANGLGYIYNHHILL